MIRLWIALSALTVAALFPGSARADRPSRGDRVKACAAHKDDKVHGCFLEPKHEKKGPVSTNLKYGWNVGMGHPVSNDNPPDYSLLLNGLDQCAWFHDRHAWRYNQRTHVCEPWELCANSVGLMRCVDAYQPENDAEKAAKKAIQDMTRPGKLCITRLYTAYGDKFERDAHGSQWLSAQSVKELVEASDKCKGLAMKAPGLDLAKARKGIKQ